jgi:hypothetical protein
VSFDILSSTLSSEKFSRSVAEIKSSHLWVITHHILVVIDNFLGKIYWSCLQEYAVQDNEMSMLRNIPEEQTSYLRRGGSLKSRVE